VNTEGNSKLASLFSKLKKIPRNIHGKVKVSVNVEWNHFRAIYNNTVFSEPVLLIIDSFGANLWIEKNLSCFYLRISLACLSMDVSFNSPCQLFYGDEFNGWIAEAIDNHAQLRALNISK